MTLRVVLFLVGLGTWAWGEQATRERPGSHPDTNAVHVAFGGEKNLLSITLDSVPVVDVVRMMTSISSTPLGVTASRSALSYRATVDLTDVDLLVAVEAVCESAGLVWRIDKEAIMISTDAEALAVLRKVKAAERSIRPPWPEMTPALRSALGGQTSESDDGMRSRQVDSWRFTWKRQIRGTNVVFTPHSVVFVQE